MKNKFELGFVEKLVFSNYKIRSKATQVNGETDDNFKLAEPTLKLFCKNYFHFGPVGMGAKSKLLNNFLTLGNAALINHMAKAAKKFDLDF